MALDFDELRELYPNLAGYNNREILDIHANMFGLDHTTAASDFGIKANKGLGGDLGTSVKQGIQEIPGMIAGVADIPFAVAGVGRPFTKAADWVAEKTGFAPGKWAADAEMRKSQGYHDTAREFDAAWANQNVNADDMVGMYATNPGYTLNSVARSLPGTVTGGVTSRALMGLGRGAALAEGVAGPVMPGAMTRAFGDGAPYIAAGAGEGVVSAGQQMAQYDPNLPNQQRNALAALGSGAVTGAIGGVLGRTANRLGIGDIDAAMAGGRAVDLIEGAAKKGFARRVGKGVASEALEEALQSPQEQMWQKYANDKPIMEGTGRASVEGALSGGVLGGGFNLKNHQHAAPLPATAPVDLINETTQPTGQLELPLAYNPEGDIGTKNVINPYDVAGHVSRGAVLDSPQQDLFASNLDTPQLPTNLGSAITTMQKLARTPVVENSPEHQAVVVAKDILDRAGVTHPNVNITPTVTPATPPSTYTPTADEVAEATAANIPPTSSESRLAAPAQVATPIALPAGLKLTLKQQPVMDHIQQAVADNRIDDIVDAKGVLQYQKIAEALGMERGSAKSFIDQVARRIATASGHSVQEFKQALQERAVAQRTTEISDQENLGLSPALQTSVINEGDLFGSEAGVEQSMGIIDSVGGSQSEVGNNELPPGYTDSVVPSEKAKAEAEANRAAAHAENEELLASHFAKTAEIDWNDAKSLEAPSFESLTPAARADFIRTYKEQVTNDDTWASIEAMQHDFERQLEPNDVTRPDERPALARESSTTPQSVSGLREQPKESESTGLSSEEGSAAKTPTNPLEEKLEALKPFLGGKQTLAVQKLINRYSDGDITLERLVGELENYKNQVEDGVKFSEGTNQGSDVKTIATTIKKAFFSPEKLNSLVKIVQSIADLPAVAQQSLSQAKDSSKVQAFVGNDGKVYMIADNISAGQEMSVFLHEVGVHLGMEKLIGKHNMTRLTSMIETWAKQDGTQEPEIAKAALERAKNSSSKNKTEEVLAYFVEEAVKAGIDPTAVSQTSSPLGQWFRTLWAAAKIALRKMGLQRFDQLTAQNLVDLAYGSAKMELTGTWHGTAADFRKSQLEHEKSKSNQTRNLVIFNDKNIQRVMTEVGASTDNIKFSEAATAPRTLPEIQAFTESGVKGMIERAKVTAKDLSKKALHSVVFTHHLVEIAVKEGLTSAKGFNTLLDEKDEVRNKMEFAVDKIMRAISQVSDKVKLENYLRDSTVSKKWGFQPTWDKTAVVDAKTKVQFDALSPAAQQAAITVFEHGDTTYKQLQYLASQEINREYDELIAQYPDDTAKYEADRALELKRHGRVLPKLQGPYAPLKRFGNHVVVAKSSAYKEAEKAKDTKTMDKLIAADNAIHYSVEFFDTAGAAAARKAQLDPLFPSVTASNKQEVFASSDTLPWSGIAKIKSAIENSEDLKNKKAMQELVGTLYLQMLGDASARKAELNRKGVAGSADMFRAFAAQGMSNAHFIATMTKSKEISQQLTAMKNEAHDAAGAKRDSATRVYNEIAARYAQGLEYSPTPLADMAMRASSIWMLLTSPAYYLTNATQTYMVTMPILGGRYGHRAFTEITKAYKDVMGHVAEMGNEFDIDNPKLPITAAERVMLKKLRDSGSLTITIASDLGRWAEGKADQGIVATAMGKINGAVTKVEALNRITTALAAYRLSGGSTEYASKIVEDTQGNYAGGNAPRFFHKNAATKLVTQFRKYQLIQVSLIGRLLHDSFKGASAAERAVARKSFAWLFAQQLLVTGLKGAPIPAVLMMLAGALGGDDDKDWERNLRKSIGDDPTSDLLLHGVPAWMGVDLSGRLGMGNAFSILPFSDIDFSKKGYKEAIFGLSGAAIGGLGGSMADGIDKIGKGQYYKGIEAMMPKGLKDGMAGYRLATEGVTNTRGDLQMAPDEVSLFDGFMKAVGLPTTTVTNDQRQRNDLYELGKHFTEKDTGYKNSYAAAARDGDTAEMQAIREEWTQTQAAKKEWTAEMKRQGLGAKDLVSRVKPLPLSTLLRAPRAQAKREKSWQRPAN